MAAAMCVGALGAGLAFGTADAAAPSAGGWSIQPTPNPSGATASLLTSVSCTSSTACTAVGYSLSKSDPSPSALAERWNGSAWSIQATPTPPRSSVNLLASVSCPSTRICVAVGLQIVDSVDRSLSEEWNGNTWTVVPVASSPKASGSGLTGVSCSSASECTAVGGDTVGNQQEQPLAETWNGTLWALEHMPNPHAENGSNATAVWCSDTTACTTTAESVYADVDQLIYALQWDGSHWARVSQPNPLGQSANYETSVSCSSAAACSSVGSWTNNGPLALAERWNGMVWARQAVPEPQGAYQSALNGVSCPRSAACMAVGTWSSTSNSIPTSTLAERWDGSTWTVVATPDPSGAEFSTLSDVSCTSPRFCLAVGDAYDPSTSADASLAEVYLA